MTTIQIFSVDDALRMAPLEPEAVAEARKAEDALVWIDLQYSEPRDVELWLDRLEITGLARRLCLGAGDRAGFYPLKKEILLIIPALYAAANPDEPTGVDHVAIYCANNLLFTIHNKLVMDEERLEMMLGEDEWLPERSVAGLVSALMMTLSLDCLRFTASLRDAVVVLEERMDRNPESLEVEEFVDLRNDLFPLVLTVSDQLPLIEELGGVERPFLNFKKTKEYMLCAVVNFRSAGVSLDWQDQRLAALRNALQMHAQEKTNHRLGILTILSAIFMPITLMAGIWGMNFEFMPEFDFRFGYPVAIGLMMTVALGMYLYFRRGGWFD